MIESEEFILTWNYDEDTDSYHSSSLEFTCFYEIETVWHEFGQYNIEGFWDILPIVKEKLKSGYKIYRKEDDFLVAEDLNTFLEYLNEHEDFYLNDFEEFKVIRYYH